MATRHYKGFSVVDGTVRAEMSFDRFKKNFKNAQFALDTRVMTEMVPLMPMNNGTFIKVTRAQSMALAGTGKVIAGAAPMGRALYYGKIMVDSETGRGPMKIATGPGEYILRFRKGARLVPTERRMNYSNPEAVPEWFEVAKEKHMQEWLALVGEELGAE